MKLRAIKKRELTEVGDSLAQWGGMGEDEFDSWVPASDDSDTCRGRE